MSKTPKLWVDFTDMLAWRGHFTGTQRVAYEIAVRLKQQYDDVNFFAYNENTEQFYAIDFAETQNNILSSQAHGTEQPALAFNRFSKQGLRSAAVAGYHNYLPARVKQHIKPQHKLLVKKVGSKALSLPGSVRARQKKVQAKISNDQGIQFEAGSIVVLLGKPWDTPTFIEQLKLQKLRNGCQIHTLVFDLIPIFLPHVFGQPLPRTYSSYMFEAISISDRMIAISHSSKEDILRYCDMQHLERIPVDVMRIGDEKKQTTTGSGNPPQQLKDRDFILSVGTIEVRKNHALLYMAYKEAIRRGEELPHIVIAGGIGWYTGDIIYQLTHDPEVKELVTILRSPDDATIEWLYENCLFTVQPSVYEGWGLPIAESLAKGKFCLSSSSSSMPEVGGDLVDYFSPYDSNAFAELLIRYSHDKKLLAEKEHAIRKNYKIQTWDASFVDFKKSIEHLF